MNVKKNKPFYFFETLVSTYFIGIIGLFTTIGIIFLTLSVIFFIPEYPQTILFCFIGVVFFYVSQRMFEKKHSEVLRNLTYDAFLTSRQKLWAWLGWSFSFYLLLIWFLMILIGSTKGLGLKYPTSDDAYVFVRNQGQGFKLTGLILLLVHIFLLMIVRLVVHYWSSLLSFAHSSFEQRRRNLELARNKANL